VTVPTLLATAEPATAPLTPVPEPALGTGAVGAFPRVWRLLGRRVIPILVAVFVANLALTQRHKLWEALRPLRQANMVWLPALVAASAATFVMAAVALTAATPHRLRFRRTMTVQVAAAFTNRLAPAGLGGMATNVRYLERCGLGRPDALSAVMITTAAGVLVHLGVVISVGLVFWFGGDGGSLPNLPSTHYWVVVGGLSAVLLGVGLVAWRRLAHHIVAVGQSIRTTATELRRRPRQLVRLLAGSAGMTCAHTLALVVCLQAFGGGVGFITIAVVYLGATGVAAAVPTPGGAGALEPILAAGLIQAGASSGAAIAAVLTYRLATFWLPLVVGVFTFRSLRRRQIL
jgi:glycosyltransferase 2 family protein